MAYRWVVAGLFLFFPVHRTGFPSFNHPFYVSVTEINFNEKEKIVEISCKIFTDDLENTLSKFSNSKINLSDQKSKPNADTLIARYIRKHLQLKIDGQAVRFQFVGSEQEAEATWSYFQVNNISSIKKINIRNDLLYESFDNQINIMHVKVHGNRQSTKLTNPETETAFEF